MNRIKTLSLPLITALVAATAPTGSAQLALSVSSKISYRQNKQDIYFKGGSFDTVLSDGSLSSIDFCNDPNYFPAGRYDGVCSPGTQGFLSAGTINGATIQRPYLVITSLTPAFAVEPFKPKLVLLVAAPASKLPRPSGGFVDNSYSVFYNLHTPEVAEYKFSRYSNQKTYTKNDRSKFETSIVPGVYRYSIPRLGSPEVGAYVSTIIYPMAEGRATRNNRTQGFIFTDIDSSKWIKEGFVELSYLRSNTIRWKGLTPNVVFAAADTLHFSMKALRDPKNPESSDLVSSPAMFPPFENGGETRTKLASPAVTQFSIPPIFPSGMRSMVEIQLDRNFKTGGVTYDFSSRRFQLPVIIINRYTEYQGIDLGLVKAPGKDILADPDNDGFNNLTEWILGSAGGDKGSVPAELAPTSYQAVNIIGAPTRLGSYFGFNVNVQTGTIPQVVYSLQRSIDQGKTWKTFRSDVNWSVERVKKVVRNISTTEIQVRSLVTVATETPATFNLYVQPPGTLTDRYRVKVTLKKKK